MAKKNEVNTVKNDIKIGIFTLCRKRLITWWSSKISICLSLVDVANFVLLRHLIHIFRKSGIHLAKEM